jgi:hypothetical protein
MVTLEGLKITDIYCDTDPNSPDKVIKYPLLTTRLIDSSVHFCSGEISSGNGIRWNIFLDPKTPMVKYKYDTPVGRLSEIAYHFNSAIQIRPITDNL